MEFPRMIFTSSSDLIVYNVYGSILYFNWKKNSADKEIQYTYAPCLINHQFVEENFDSSGLSLEQQKQCEMENHRKIQVQKRKAEILEIIGKLKIELTEIKLRNSRLPTNYRLGADAFEIDKRITEDLKQKTEQKFKSIQMELQRRIDRIRAQAVRMEHLYLDNLEHWPITLTGFR